jgi:hypothetical protein
VGGKLNVYNLGEKGVNVTKTPLHHEDGELLSGQNAEFYAEAGLGGLHKRPGLQRFNTSDLTAPVKGVIGIPLPGPGERGVYVDTDLTTTPWQVTHDGSTFNAADGFQQWGAVGLKAVHLLGQFFFAGVPLGVPGDWMVMGFDGSMEYELYRFANADVNEVELLGTHDNKIILREEDNTFGQRIKLLDPLTGDITQVADVLYTAFRPFEHAACSYLGRIWVGYPGAAFAEVAHARLGDTSWTLDYTHATMQTVWSMRPFLGDLYVGFQGGFPALPAAVIEKRTAAGVWSLERTGGGSTDVNWFSELTIHQGKLYAIYKHAFAAGDLAEIHVKSAGVWATDKDLAAVDPTVAVTPQRLLSVGQTIFCSVDADVTLVGGIWKKVGSGAWVRANALQLGAGAGLLAVV